MGCLKIGDGFQHVPEHVHVPVAEEDRQIEMDEYGVGSVDLHDDFEDLAGSRS